MDPLTWLSLGLQLAALCSIVAALLLYLLRKVRVAEDAPAAGAKTVLVTSVDTALGLQIATYLASRGWRVLAGGRAGGLGARLAGSWRAARAGCQPPAMLATLELDVAREDLLEQAARATAQHLPAGEHGLWAVINTAGSGARAAAAWDAVLRANVLGALRVARTFAPLLAAAAADHPQAGRLFFIGLTSDTSCSSLSTPPGAAGEADAAGAAARWGVWGAAHALRGSLRARGVAVVLLHAPDLHVADVYAPPAQVAPGSAPASRPDTPSSGASGATCAVSMPAEAGEAEAAEAAEYCARVLPAPALRCLEDALAAPAPKDSYCLRVKPDGWFARVPSLRAH